MSIRESLNRIPPAISIIVACVIIVVLGIFIFSQLGLGGGGETQAVEAGAKTTLKCSNCGYTFERDTAELQRMSPLPGGRIDLTSEMATCPKCGRTTLGIVSGPANQ